MNLIEEEFSHNDSSRTSHMSYLTPTSIREALEIVKISGYNLEFVPEEYRTREVCLAAIEEDSYSIQYIENPTEEMCLAAVKIHGWALSYIENQTEEICLEAIKQDPYALRFVKKQTPQLIQAAVLQNPKVIKYLKPWS
jgi:hypothetical protein